MSADLLREAASQMRAGRESDENADPAEAEFYIAIAEWLEVVAERQKPLERYNRRSHGWTGSRQANAVARAYLGRDA